MMFWSRRKNKNKVKASSSRATSLRMEQLEERAMMAAIPLVSGQTVSFQDADGTQVKVKLTGPGQGTIELENGLLTGAAIDNITLTDTGSKTKLNISTRGGSVAGTTINELVITKALNELGALRLFKAKQVDFADGGEFTADGDIHKMYFRALGTDATIDIDGNVGHLNANVLRSDSTVDVSGTVNKFDVSMLANRSQVSAYQLNSLNVKQEARGASVDIGEGGLGKAKFQHIFDSAVGSAGQIGKVIVQRTAVSSGFGSNVDKGADGIFGTLDDLVIDPNATGYIHDVKFKGYVGAEYSADEVNIVSSHSVGNVSVNKQMQNAGIAPYVWDFVTSTYIPLSISQLASATGFDDDNIWLAIFGTQQPIKGATSSNEFNFYLDSTSLTAGNDPNPVATTSLSVSGLTPNLPTLPSSTLQDWSSASLSFPVPKPGYEWTGRIVISVGVPVQAQVTPSGNYDVNSPSPINPTDPATGTIYDFLEFTVVNDVKNGISLDVDTSIVDAFGLPMSLQFFKDAAGTMPVDFSFSGDTTLGSQLIQNISGSQTLHQMVLGGLATSQPITGIGIPLGTTIQNYDIDANTITINVPATATNTGTTLDVASAGPVGIAADRDTILTGSTTDSLYNYLLDQIASGSANAQPFLQSAAPYPVSGPTPIVGVTVDDATIDFTSVTGAGPLNAGDAISIYGVGGTTALNGEFIVEVITQTQLTLGGPVGNGAYTTGGQWSVGGTNGAISGASNNGAAIVITTTANTLPTAGQIVTITGVGGNTAANGTFKVHSVNTSAKTFTLGTPYGAQTYTSGGFWSPLTEVAISDATNASPIQITATNTNNLIQDSLVTISGVQGNTNANGTYLVKNLTANTFDLYELDGTTPVAGNGAYVASTATWSPAEKLTDAALGGAITINTDSTAGLANGDTIFISGIQGTTSANGVFTISNVTPTSFTLDGASANGAYTSGGTWSLAITGADALKSQIVTNDTTGVSFGDVVTITGATGDTSLNGSFLVDDFTATTISLGGPISNNAYTSGGYWTLPSAGTTPLTGATNAGPIVITTGYTHGLADGDSVFISGVGGNANANGQFVAKDVTATTFALYELDGTTPVNGNAAYTSGGVWQQVNAISNASHGSSAIEITTDNVAGLAVGGVVKIDGVGGNTAANGMFIITGLTATTITLGSPASTSAYTGGATWTGNNGGSGSVSAAIRGGEILITASNTDGLADGDLVNITGVLGNTAANGFYTISHVSSTGFVLVGSLGSGTFQSSTTTAGTWTEYTKFNRLVSPKDVVEGLLSPQDTNVLNNYYNEVIDDFFLKYLPSDKMAGNRQGGGELLEVVSSAGTTSPVTYYGFVTKDGTANGGYVMRFYPSTQSQPTITTYASDTLDVYYPFFTTNLPDPDVYVPLFTVAEPPHWITKSNQQLESASQMIFACDAVFADNVERQTAANQPNGTAMSATPAVIIADLENSISAAFNRGIALNDGSTWGDVSTWFPAAGRYNYWVEYWHQSGLTINELAYAFPYDDKFGASTNLDFAVGGANGINLAKIVLGDWSASAAASQTAFTTTPPPTTAGGSVTITAEVTGTNPGGTVGFFINGVAINRTNSSSAPPFDLIEINGSGVATITANLPALPATTAGQSQQTYVLTAVYSGDANNKPSVAHTTLAVLKP